MRVNGRIIKFKDCGWFADKEPLIIAAKNPTEREKRLDWLSQGLLKFNMNPDVRPPANFVFGTNGGDPTEKQLYAAFVQHLDGVKTEKTKMNFKQYFTEKRMEDEGQLDPMTGTSTSTGSYADYKIRKPTSQIPKKHIWLDLIKTPEEMQRRGGATRLIQKLKDLAVQKNLPIYLSPLGPKTRVFYYNKGFKQVPFNVKLLYWDHLEDTTAVDVSKSPEPVLSGDVGRLDRSIG